LSQILGPRSAFDAPSGIYNLTCSGSTTWFGFARTLLTRSFARTGETLPLLTPIDTAAYPTPARRPVYSCLDGARLKGTFGLALPPWETALDLVLDTLAAYEKH
jgi:dTDP-4-dehydrorhamnose reductase